MTDQDTKNKIWKRGDTIFYKGGVTDPDYFFEIHHPKRQSLLRFENRRNIDVGLEIHYELL